MRVTALGHAGLRVDDGATTLLIDPWFSPEGAFQASWFQWPPNRHLIEPALFRPDAIALSHEHIDHLDPWFLARVPEDVPIVVPRYPSTVIKKKLAATGPHRVVELDAWEHYDVGGIQVFFVGEESPMNHDGAVVATAGGRSLLNVNDSRLSPLQFRAIRQAVGGVVDLFTFQGAGASWYPMCYRFPEEHSTRLAYDKRMAKLAYGASAMRIVEPVMGAPFGGPPCFLDPELFVHNEQMDEKGIFPDQEQARQWLAEQGITNTILLLPGDRWDTVRRERTPDPEWRNFSFADRDEHLEAYARDRKPAIDDVKARHPHPTESLWPAFRDYFEALLAMSPYFNERVGMRVGFHITGPGGGEWAVDFRPGQEAVEDHVGDCGYHYQFGSRWLPPLLDGSVPWEDFFLSLRFESWREPDLYNDHLLGVLKFADPEPLLAVEQFETAMDGGERFVLEADGCRYSVARRCPHAGNDLLETGEVLEGGVLRCLAHHYEYDLATGECRNGRSRPLSVDRLGPA